MKGYFYALLLTSVFGGVSTILVQGGYEKYTKYISSLICVLLLISPFRNIDITDILKQTENITSVSQVDNKLYDNTLELTENSAKNYITEIVFKEFGIKPSYINIQIEMDNQELVIKDITLAVSSAEINNKEKIKEYLFNALGCEVKIIEE